MKNTPSSEFERAARQGGSSGFFAELGRFLWHTKKWWMIPILVVLVLFGILTLLSSSAAAPFIYTLF